MAATDVGTIEAIHLADRAGAPVRAVDSIAVHAGVGLTGARYGDLAESRVSPNGKPRGDVTLIETEQLEWLAGETGIRLAPGEARRNLTTHGVRLLDDGEIRVGDPIEVELA